MPWKKYEKIAGIRISEDIPAALNSPCIVLGRAFLSPTPSGRYYALVVAKCVCGVTFVASINRLRSGKCRSCVCLSTANSRIQGLSRKTHGLIKTRYYRTWAAIKSRCYCETNKDYADWGGRGIAVFSDWLNDPVAFMEYVSNLPNSQDTTLTLDRIDNSVDYCPGNLRWATYKEQNNNNRNVRLLTCRGETRSMSQWADFLGIKDHTIYNRIKLGWSVEEAMYGKK